MSDIEENEWESRDLARQLRGMYATWIRRDVIRVHLEGGIWGVGLVITYWDRSEYRELLENVVEENELRDFCMECGPRRNEELFLSLEPDTLAWYFSVNLMTYDACREVKERLGQGGPPILC